MDRSLTTPDCRKRRHNHSIQRFRRFGQIHVRSANPRRRNWLVLLFFLGTCAPNAQWLARQQRGCPTFSLIPRMGNRANVATPAVEGSSGMEDDNPQSAGTQAVNHT